MSAGKKICWLNAIRTAVALILLIPSVVCAASPAQQRTVYATIPWLSSMARFIVGTTVNVQSLTSWTSTGTLRTIRKIPQNPTVIALDPRDSVRYNFKPGRQGLYLLYENLPISDEDRTSIFFDPSILPFLSQRMLIILCELEPENYSFYQRRLAEFQSRLESTLEVGRSLVGNIPMLDLTGSVSPWIRAASEYAVRPPGDLWSAWADGRRTQELALALKEAERRGWWIVIDAWTPPQVRSQVMGVYKNVCIEPPEADHDFFTFLHDIYLRIWSASTGN